MIGRLAYAALTCLVVLAAPAQQALAGQPGYVTLVEASPPDPNGKLPTYVDPTGSPSSPGISALEIGIPVSVLHVGRNYVYFVQSQNGKFNGVCKTSYKITQKQGTATVVLQTGLLQKFNCEPGTIFGWAIEGAPIPDAPGPAMLTGIVKFGGTKISLAVPIVIKPAQ